MDEMGIMIDCICMLLTGLLSTIYMWLSVLSLVFGLVNWCVINKFSKRVLRESIYSILSYSEINEGAAMISKMYVLIVYLLRPSLEKRSFTVIYFCIGVAGYWRP